MLLSIVSPEQLQLLVRSAGLFGERETFEDLSADFNLTRTVVGRRVGQAKARLQHPSNARLVEVLPIDTRLEGTEWHADANCREKEQRIFFPERGDSSTKRARRACGSCAVRAECLEWAMEHTVKFGIWGGLSENQREKLRKQQADAAAEPVAE